MGTRSRIAVQLPNGTFKSVYCHWDGYPDYNGRILQEHYTDPAKVLDLVELGDMSILGHELGTKHAFDARSEEIGNVCTFYGRDRGEKGVDASISLTLGEVSALTRECGGEWLYVFMDGDWWVAKGGVSLCGEPADKSPGGPEPLERTLARLDVSA